MIHISSFFVRFFLLIVLKKQNMEFDEKKCFFFLLWCRYVSTWPLRIETNLKLNTKIQKKKNKNKMDHNSPWHFMMLLLNVYATPAYAIRTQTLD